MKTTTIEGPLGPIHAIHHTDCSGDVLFSVPRAAVQHTDDPVPTGLPEYVQVTIPFDVLQALVAMKVRSALERRLEQMDDDELLGLIAAGRGGAVFPPT